MNYTALKKRERQCVRKCEQTHCMIDTCYKKEEKEEANKHRVSYTRLTSIHTVYKHEL
jgi:hypothetical protein